MSDKIDNAASLAVERVITLLLDDFIVVEKKIESVVDYRKLLVFILCLALDKKRPQNKPEGIGNFRNTYKQVINKMKYYVDGEIANKRHGNIACSRHYNPIYCQRYKTCMVCPDFKKNVYKDEIKKE